MPQDPPTIRWHRPALPEKSLKDATGVEVLAIPLELDPVRQIVMRVGIPIVEGAVTAKEYAIGLLKLAGEVEHALMAQYLYAAFSLSDQLAMDSINYQRKAMAIAVQEMGHLTTIQGPTFTLDASILNSINENDLITQHLRLLDGLTSLYSAIELSSDFASFPDHANTLANLRNIDQMRRNLFSQPGPPPT